MNEHQENLVHLFKMLLLLYKASSTRHQILAITLRLYRTHVEYVFISCVSTSEKNNRLVRFRNNGYVAGEFRI
jgi:hypothetical protein